MKKKDFVNSKYLQISLYTLFVILVAIVFDKTVGNVSSVFDSIKNVISMILKVMRPFVYGLFIAYLINCFVKFIENKCLTKIKSLDGKRSTKRILSIAISYIIVLGLLIWIIAYIIPEMVTSITNLVVMVQEYLYSLETGAITYANGNELLRALISDINETFNTSYTVSDLVNSIVSPIMKAIQTLPLLFKNILTGTVNFANAVLNFVLGIIISFYMLYEKENYASRISKILYILFKPKNAENIIKGAQESNSIFEKFIVGKTIDSLIIGLMFFIIALIIKLPYALLLSVIIGLTNMIPYFGPFIGGIPAVIITLLNDFKLGVWVGIIVLALQQFDGNILGPKILGDSTGLKPLGVMFATLIGGTLFGVLGMFLGVPVVAILKIMFVNLTDKSYDKKYSQK